jgi:hypothetical protein
MLLTKDTGKKKLPQHGAAHAYMAPCPYPRTSAPIHSLFQCPMHTTIGLGSWELLAPRLGSPMLNTNDYGGFVDVWDHCTC